MALRVVIDAGHGGGDPGAVNGHKHEATAALAIAKKVAEKLKKSGVLVEMTRTKNTGHSLKERCAVSNTWKADCFVSIHLNAAENEEAEGIETWRYAKVGARTKALANNVQTELIRATCANDRGVKVTENLYVLKHTEASAILVEVGFISNCCEVHQLFCGKYQEKIAEGIATGVLKAFS